MEFLNHRVGRMLGAGDVVDRLVSDGVKRLPNRLDLGDSLSFEEVEQRPQHHLDTLAYRLGSGAAGARRSQCTLEIIDDGQKIAQPIFPLNTDRFFALLANPLSCILAVSKCAQIFVFELREFFFLICKSLRQICRVFGREIGGEILSL